MSAQPKWQRVRYIGPDTVNADRGDLFWVAVGPPTSSMTVDGNVAGDILLASGRARRSGFPLAFNPQNVELLPEFSFADDPDAEVRR